MPIKSYSPYAVFCVFLFSATVLSAQWHALNNGLYGGPCDNICEQNGTLFSVSTSLELYRSEDGGRTWTMLPSLPLGGYPCMGSTQRNVLVSNHGLWLSSDKGQTWDYRGLDSVSFRSFLVRGDTVVGATNYGVYLSLDQGINWTYQPNKNAPAQALSSFALMGNIILAVNTQGVFESKDVGASWDSVSTFDVNSIQYPTIATTGDTVVATTYDGHFFYSFDTARTWISATGPRTWLGLQIHNGTCYLMCYDNMSMSSDLGLTWTRRNYGVQPPGEVVCMTWLNDTMVVGSHEGVFRTTDMGASWLAAYNGIECTTVWSLSAWGDNLYVGTYDNGFYRSSNRGTTWERMPDAAQFIFGTPCLLALGDTLLAGTQGRGLAVSGDRGLKWDIPVKGMDRASGGVRALAYGNGILYASDATSGDGIFRSADRGMNWQLNATGLAETISAVDIAVQNDSVVIADDNGPFVSIDQGLTWESANYGIEGIQAKSVCVRGKDIWMASNSNGMFHSSDFGNTWLSTNDGISNPHMIRVRLYGNILVAVATAYYEINSSHPLPLNVYASVDEGKHWKSIVGNLPSAVVWGADVVDSMIYVGSSGYGLYAANIQDFDLQADVQDSPVESTGNAQYAVHSSIPTSILRAFNSQADLCLNNLLGRAVCRWSVEQFKTSDRLDLSTIEPGAYVLTQGLKRTTILVY